ncbi:hypothetical protein ACJBV9_10370, partial [Streptococcus suis]|uniref:hypothetical protein n=1 Tax=Streptococcus suis TaxID=1307 RepID=UPI00201A59F7
MKVSTLERTSCFERKNQALEQKDNEVILVYIYMPCSAMLANMASTEKFTKKQVSKPNHLFFSKRTYKIGNPNCQIKLDILRNSEKPDMVFDNLKI